MNISLQCHLLLLDVKKRHKYVTELAVSRHALLSRCKKILITCTKSKTLGAQAYKKLTNDQPVIQNVLIYFEQIN